MLIEDDCLDTLLRDVEDNFLIKSFFLTTNEGDHRDSSFLMLLVLLSSSRLGLLAELVHADRLRLAQSDTISTLHA